MNEACKDSIKTKSVNKKPNPPKSKAIVGSLNPNQFTNIDPTSTPASAYIKKTK